MVQGHSTFSYLSKRRKPNEDERGGRATARRQMQLIALSGFSVFKYCSECKLVKHVKIALKSLYLVLKMQTRRQITANAA